MSEMSDPHSLGLFSWTQYLLVQFVSALIWLSYASLLFLGLIDNARGPFYLEILEDMNVTATTGSLFFATVSLSAFVGSLTVHRMLGHRSSISLLIISCFVLSIGVGFVSLSPSILWLLLSCIVFGWGFGILNLAQNALVIESAPLRWRRQFLSGLHSMYGLAALLAPLSATGFRWMGFSWRGAFAILAIFPCVIALIALPKMVKKSWLTQTPPRARLTRQEWLYLVLFSVLVSGYLYGELSISSRLVLWLRTERNFDAYSANYYLSVFFLLLLAGRLVFTFLDFSRYSNVWILSVSAGISGFAYLMGLLIHPGFLIFSGLCMAPFFPAAMDQLGVVFGPKSGQAIAFTLGFGSLSIVFMHLALGWLNDHWGLTQALSLCAGALLIVSLGVTQLTRYRPLPIMTNS